MCTIRTVKDSLPFTELFVFNDVGTVVALLNNGADISLADKLGFTPFTQPFRFERTEIVKLLLQRGADPFIENDAHLTPLHIAARRGFTEISSLLLKDARTCELFLRNGADIMYRALSRSTPLHLAAWQGYEDICQLLIETASMTSSVNDYVNIKNKEGTTALHGACMRGHAGVVDLLLRHNADRDAVNWVACTSPLHLAAKHGHLTAAAFNNDRIVKLLLENGADPEAKDNLAMTPFLNAVTNGANQSVTFCGNCKNLTGKRQGKIVSIKGQTFADRISLGSWNGGFKDFEILLQEKCLLNERDVNENAPLHIAAKNGSLDCVDFLSDCPEFPFQLNERNDNGMTPLHLAASNKHTETCKLLISKGADVTATGGNGSTPLHLAVKAGSLKTVKILLNCLLPSTLEQEDSVDNTPLHVACEHNRRDVLKFLLDKGADVTSRNDRDMTCLDVAIEWEGRRGGQDTYKASKVGRGAEIQAWRL
ncbi:hypothetical protein OS493_013803 [Desmophyllum pertusum]|uniref:Uncharacterized protein n=1 Tax=Desmophyllum pertusum TaxID=174260 RepID=A0A9X0D5N2_9CNID|nr:hypothetical protein OS493_013803 [Desmophyllum pertusum]